tara:strand:- start:76 stop:354 length:279 start_codon:yes stop_codon:yes gene_type:complete
MEANYKKGDIVYLNTFGTIVLEDDNKARVGIIIAGPSNYLVEDEDGHFFYWVYDVMIGNQLIKDIPQEFMDRIINEQHEENPQGMEEFPKRK